MNVVVIGAGASGLMCAAQLIKNKNINVILIDKNEKIGKKLYITGKGRCNVTNNKIPMEFLDNVITNSKFLFSSIFSFTPQDTISFFEENHINLKIERGDRVFPVSDKSSDIIKGLENSINYPNCTLKLNEQVLSIIKNEDNFIVKTSKDKYLCDNVVVATGGITYPSTGSTGDGYNFAKSFGHKITKLYPGLCAINLKDTDIRNCAGLTLKNVNVMAIDKSNKKLYENFGEVLFTHKGLSGPTILTLSSHINKRPDLNKCRIVIDLKPALNETVLDKRILKDFEIFKNKNIENGLKKLLLSSLIPLVLKRANINPNKVINSITQKERMGLVENIKNLTFNILSLDEMEHAVVTSGGINIKELNNKTMESRITPGIYYIGEIIDVDAKTGGYSIQIAFSTAVSAAIDIINKIQI